MSTKIITKNIWYISLISLFTDMASEMLYPIMPFFLGHIGFSVLYIGILEGLAEAVAGLSKPYFGRWSDSLQRRLPFVQWGYALSAISKPMMAAFFYPIWIFFSRTIDRLGKGMRTGARDALLSDESSAKTKATVFGFHRSLDTVGAVLGPLLALVFLYFFPHDYVSIFLLAFIPGIAAVIFTFFIREKKREPSTSPAKRPGLFAFVAYWKKSPQLYRKLLWGLLLFAAFNSSDLFLLIKMKEAGLTSTSVVAVYIFYNLVYALLAYPVGIWADKWGMKNVFICGLIAFILVYIGFAFFNDLYIFLALFVFYGFYAAATESVAKAWISNMVDKADTASAIGTYSGFQSLALFLASGLCGFVWFQFGAVYALCLSAAAALIVVIYLSTVPFRQKEFK